MFKKPLIFSNRGDEHPVYRLLKRHQCLSIRHVNFGGIAHRRDKASVLNPLDPFVTCVGGKSVTNDILQVDGVSHDDAMDELNASECNVMGLHVGHNLYRDEP